MNTTTASNNSLRSGIAGVPRAIWIGGALMGLTIIALATTLVVRGNDSLPDPAAAPAVSTVAALPGDASAPVNESSVAPSPVVVARPVHEAPRVVHHVSPGRETMPEQVASVPVCASCGVIESYSAVQVQGQNNGVGAVAGGLGGALVGSKIGGRGNHTLGGVIGAVGGGLLGNAIESHERTATVYDVHVRMNDGTVRTVRQGAVPAVGTHVNVEGNTLRAADVQG